MGAERHRKLGARVLLGLEWGCPPEPDRGRLRARAVPPARPGRPPPALEEPRAAQSSRLAERSGPHNGSVVSRTVTPKAHPRLPRPSRRGASHPCTQEKSREKTLDHRNVNP